MTELEQIGQRLNILRNSLELSQKELAQQLNVQQGFINAIIHGKKGIGQKVLINISKGYPNLNLRWLLTGEGEMWMFPNYYPHPKLESGIPDKLEEGVRIEYANAEGQLEAMQRRLEDHEQRLRDLEGRE